MPAPSPAPLAALVAAIATNRLWALDFFHVVGGGLWTGVDLFVGFVVGPIIRPALGPAVGLLAAGGALLGAGIVSVSRIRPFAWSAFFLVGKWALAAYAVIAGMLEYIFVLDGTRGALLAVLSLMLVLFAVDVPLLFAFSVARYQEPTAPRASAR